LHTDVRALLVQSLESLGWEPEMHLADSLCTYQFIVARELREFILTLTIQASLLFRFKLIVKPIADACIREEQKNYVDFEPYYTHIVCHECCHGIGPHSIILPSGKKSTVRMVCMQIATKARSICMIWCYGRKQKIMISGALVDCRCLDGCTGTSGISFSIGRGKS
jgi:hypothetical protein